MSVCRWYDLMHQKHKDTTIKLFRLINKFTNISIYKINIQKSILCLYIYNKLSKKETKNTTDFAIAL
jgi:hypothetical protein